MKQVLNALFGFAAILFALSFMGSISIVGVLTLYAAALYFIFFPAKRLLGYPMLIGATVAGELLGTLRFGSYTLFGFIFILSGLLFAGTLRFTSPYNRYIVCLLLVTLIFPMVLFDLRLYISYLPYTFATLVLSVGTSALVRQYTDKPEYELI